MRWEIPMMHKELRMYKSCHLRQHPHGLLSCWRSGCCFPTASNSLQLPAKGLKTDSHASSLRSWDYYCLNAAISPAGRPAITNSKQVMKQLPFTLLCLRSRLLPPAEAHDNCTFVCSHREANKFKTVFSQSHKQQGFQILGGPVCN